MRGVASSEHYGYPRSISLDIRDVSSDSSSSSSSSSRSNISSRISRQFEPSLPPLSLGDSRILHGQNASKPIDRDSGNIGTSVSMIRTCPIPERLRLHKKDIQDYSAENSSPGQIVSSANTLADSPRTLPDHGVHRRATVSTSSTGGTLDADRRNAPRTPDQPLSMKKPSVISASPRNEKQHPTKTLSSVAPGSAARRTSSTNSSWSVATPTSASDIAGDNAVAPGTMLCGGYSAFLPDWEPVSTGQQQMQAPLTPYPLRSRTKGRRYSVFDVSFANQPRSEGNAGNYNYSGGVPMPIPQTTPIHARRLHKMDSSKVFTGEEDTLSAHELSSFGQSSNASPRSESELLRIIQDLGGFVEDGLRYVNEDSDPSDPESVHGVAHCATAISEKEASYISGDDEDGTHTPGLVIARKSLSDQHSKNYFQDGPTDSGSYLLPFEPEMRGYSRSSARLGLECLNGRLHDMLDLHDSRVEESSGRASSAEPGSYATHDVATSQIELDSSEQSRPHGKLVKAPSIRRLAVLKTLAGGADNAFVPGVDQSRHHVDKRRSRVVTAQLAQESKFEVGALDASRSVSPDIPELESRRYSLDRSSVTERRPSQASVHSIGSRSSLAASPLIEEDRFKPTPLIEAIMDLVNIIGCVINLSADDMLHPISSQLLDETLESANETAACFNAEEERERVLSMMPTEYIVQQLNALGSMWQRSSLFLGNIDTEQQQQQRQQPWPCRGLFFRALLSISSLNRIVMWYVAVRSTYSEDVIEQLDKRTQVDSFTGSPEQGPGLVNDSLSDNQTQSDTASVPSLPYIYTDSPSSPGISSSAMTSKDVVHNTPPKPRGIVKASIASSSGLYQDESQQASTDIISSNNSTDSQVYDASRPPQWNKAASSILDTAVFDKGLNMLLEVALDGRIRYISPTCRQLLGIDPESVVDLPTTAIFDTEDAQVCRSAVEQLLADSTRTVEIGVKVHGPGSSIVVDVEAKGMLMYSRTRNEPSHVLWVLRYVPSKLLVRNAQMDASTYSLDSKAGLANDGHVLPVFELITCRICDMSVPVTYFEEHTWLCAKSHRAAMDVCRQNDRLSDLKTEIQAWYPSCDVNDLEAFVHGEIDSEALREKTENRAAEIGGPAWQSLVKEATTVTISMLDICSQAIAVDENDAVPICELPGPTDRGRVSNLSSDGINNSKDFVRSRLWTKVEYYQPPSPEYTDDSLMAIQILLLDAIKAKLDAVDALQYAIIDSSVALSRWVPPECELVDNNACLHSERPLDDQNVVSTGSQNDNDLKGTSENVGVVLDTADICGLGDGSEYRQALPKDTSHIQNTRSTCAYLKPATVPPATQRPSGISDAASNAGQLRILTKDLHPAPSRSQTRSSISSNALLATPTMPTISDFALLKPISKGAYGSVYLAKKRTTGEYYAIKVLRKADMIAKNQISNVKAERAIMMAQTGSPFVVRLLYTFQSRTNLYLVMEYLNGGDCASLLKAIGTLPEGWARQYLAEVVLGIQDLHTRNVVHRDLKPDNLLIDSEGHLKLTDFGLSKLGFLGRRVDQQTANNPLQSDDTPARQPCTQKAKGTFSSGGSLLPLSTSSIPGLTQPLPSSIPYSIYSQGTDTCSISSHDERHFGDVPFAVPSIVTPPTIKNDTYQHLDSAHSSQVSSASRPIADIIPSKRVAALKPASDKSSLSDSNGGCEAPSTSSSASLRSVGFDAVAPPSHHKHALGTPDYIAPESILGLEAGKDVDWWALGIICYEFIFGIPPFHDETPEKVFKNILSAETDFYDDLHDQLEAKRKQPSKSTDDICSSFGEDGYDDDEPDVPSISPEIRDFITKLLCRDPKQRLGHNGAEEVKAHPMFRGIDWNTLLETQASFIPNVENIEDTDYFDSRGATMNDNESMDRLEGKLDERHVRGKPSISGVVDTHVQDTRLHAITIPELDTNSENRVSKSHEVQSDISNPVCRVPISRAKTLPAILDDDDLYNEASSANSETNNDSNVPQVLSPELPTSKGIKDLKDIHGQKHSQHLPPVDDTPDSDFGVFTFKNLHALEQANMNELVKLRRRSTMLDVSGAPPVQSSFSFGSSSPTSPSPLARTTHRYSHTGISFGGDVDSSGITSSSSNSNIALQPYQMIPARKLLSTQVLHNTEHQASRPENATSPYQQRYSYDHQLPFTTAAHKDHHLHMSDRLPLFGASPEAPSSDAPDSGPPATQYGYGHRKSLLNPDARLPFHSYKPPVASHGSDIYRPATTSDLDSEIHISYDEPKEPAYTQSSICLVADDNPVCCKVMEVMLRRLHLQCVIVRNGAEALRCAMGRTAFRAIFMDTGMPIVDGDEATRMIKSTYNINKNTPVIAMTTYEGEAADALYDGSIVKPATLQHVKKSLAYTD
ncbi:rim15, signal transduction response regulator [Coemansia sp. RSA 1813]|nr:rim15, signal transduction response regulator [Coemansia sp. RSA 1843]KAJ2572300.1 rim15, signal transduction response regulator [Coemansia sp. RSA 1813]